MNPPRILFIDDHHDHLLLCRLILERRNYQVKVLDTCDPLDSFIGEVRTFQPDLIFLDHQMPAIYGPGAIKALRLESDLQKIPIIYFSANDQLEELARQVGADDYLQKPFEIAGLLAITQKYSPHQAA